MSDFETVEVVEQEGVFDGRWSLPIDTYLLMRIVNHFAATDDEEMEEMSNPKRIAVRVIIQTKETGLADNGTLRAPSQSD